MVDLSMYTDSFPYICQYCSSVFFITFSMSKVQKYLFLLHQKFMQKVLQSLSVLHTKVKGGMVQSKAFFFHSMSRFPWTSLVNQSCFYVFSTPCEPSLCQTNSASFGFFISWLSILSRISLLTG